MIAIDLSNYTDPLTPQSVQALKDTGVQHVIVQAIDPPAGYPAGRTREQIQACLDGGLTVDAYIWLWFDAGLEDIGHKLSLLDGLPIRQLWLDVEDTAAIKYDQATCEMKVASALKVCDAYPTTSKEKTGVYTGRWFWADRRYMGNTTAFSDRELWDANYDQVADAAVDFVPYGGWTKATIKQFRGSTSVAGVGGLDLNVLSVEEEAEFAGGGQQPTQEGDVHIPQEYVTKFGLPDDNSQAALDGLINNLEGVISTVREQASAEGADDAAKLAKIKEIVAA